MNPMKYVMGVYALTGGVYATAYEIVSAVFGKTAMGDLFYVAKDIKDLKGRADKRKSLKDLSASKLYVEAIVGKKSGGILHFIGFEKLCRQVFKEADIDRSGTIDSTEVEIMILKIYGKINIFTGGRCVPPSRTEIEQMLNLCDLHGGGSLDADEFVVLATLLSEAISARVFLHVLMHS